MHLANVARYQTCLWGISSISDYAFRECSGLKNVIIPKAVKRIENNTFLLCNNLSKVFYCGTEKEWKKVEGSSNKSLLLNASVYYYSEKRNTTGNYWRYVGGIPTAWK